MIMFTIQEIQEAHSKVKSGADFPKYVQDLIGLGVLWYDTFVADGRSQYFGANEYKQESGGKYETLAVNETSDAETFKHYLKIHQQGETNYPTFCKHAAETGVHKWTVDLRKMTCTYYDRSGNEMIVEGIPS
jgi:uncharacterized protein YbcV (DUF1398 family)